MCAAIETSDCQVVLWICGLGGCGLDISILSVSSTQTLWLGSAWYSVSMAMVYGCFCMGKWSVAFYPEEPVRCRRKLEARRQLLEYLDKVLHSEARNQLVSDSTRALLHC